MVIQVFLSYTRQDEGVVKQLYVKLKSAGFKPWMDINDILPGERWADIIYRAIQKSHFFLACISKNSVDRRGFLQREIRAALDTLKELLDTDIYVIPVRLDDCQIPENLSLFQWIDLFNENGWEQLLKSLHKGIATRFGTIPLRSKPIENFTQEEVDNLFNRNNSDFLYHNFEKIEREGETIILDSTTGLYWEQSGSEKELTFDDAKKYIHRLNECRLGGNNNWRLPTLEEAISLIQPKEGCGASVSFQNDEEIIKRNPCVNDIFDQRQYQVWASDKQTPDRAWIVSFYGFWGTVPMSGSTYVRAVCSE